MSCCCPPAGPAYLRQLLARRHDIAVFPANALDQEEPPESVYFYRPGELLLPEDELEEFQRVARDLKLRYVVLYDAPEPACSEDRSDGFDPNAAPVARVLIGGHGDLESIIDTVEHASGGQLHPSPNHVWFSCPRFQGSPYGDPSPYSLSELESANEAALETSERGATVLVAVVDGGLPEEYERNPFLAPVRVDSPAASQEETWGYADPTEVMTSPDGHGAFVCGVVRLAQPALTVNSYKAIDSDGVVDQTDLISELSLALTDGPTAINLSLGGYTRKNLPPIGFGALEAAAQASDGPIVVAAAGNDDWTRPFWPAAFSWVISVGATQPRKNGGPVRASFSNHGPWVDVWANGVNVVSTYEANAFQPSGYADPIVEFDGAALWNGTSFAAPLVAARVAAYRAAHPGAGRAAVLTHLESIPGSNIPGLGTLVR